MAIRAILTLNGKEYEVLQYEHCFHLTTDPYKGYPLIGNPYGGELHFLINTPEDNFLLDLMYSVWDKPSVEGELNVYDGLEDMPVRRITFRKALFNLYQDRFTTKTLEPWLSDGESNMQTRFVITAQEMIINKFVRMSRNHWWRWVKVQDDELMPQTIISNPEMRLVDAYWIKEDQSLCRVFPIGQKVCLHLVLGDFETFIGTEVGFNFNDVTEEGVYSASVKGTVPEDGVIIVENFTFSKRKE
ncbi:MAG: type VI secretion system tube protein TssD [Bacteroidales bacterium]|uniref:type VI secretion system tube protein TssD n=1 Tax=Porphyromonas sp. TaxID=1924944 RepID=UPI002974176F|nr:type VI secretion system tube protein TssD [Porphyromonas sp.]MDD7437934.1 type VI secretion system tube protein TssD [Bacteroidales bacterium]MDY3067184.1 type VI secretion system tube protein TssD [Porphyromonas sp.]